MNEVGQPSSCSRYRSRHAGRVEGRTSDPPAHPVPEVANLASRNTPTIRKYRRFRSGRRRSADRGIFIVAEAGRERRSAGRARASGAILTTESVRFSLTEKARRGQTVHPSSTARESGLRPRQGCAGSRDSKRAMPLLLRLARLVSSLAGPPAGAPARQPRPHLPPVSDSPARAPGDAGFGAAAPPAARVGASLSPCRAYRSEERSPIRKTPASVDRRLVSPIP